MIGVMDSWLVRARWPMSTLDRSDLRDVVSSSALAELNPTSFTPSAFTILLLRDTALGKVVIPHPVHISATSSTKGDHHHMAEKGNDDVIDHSHHLLPTVKRTRSETCPAPSRI